MMCRCLVSTHDHFHFHHEIMVGFKWYLDVDSWTWLFCHEMMVVSHMMFLIMTVLVSLFTISLWWPVGKNVVYCLNDQVFRQRLFHGWSSCLAHFTDVMMLLFASQSLALVNNDRISLWWNMTWVTSSNASNCRRHIKAINNRVRIMNMGSWVVCDNHVRVPHE